LPKGKLKPGESFVAAALREVEEETGCVARLEGYLGAIGYEVKGDPKVVLFWRMSLVSQKEIEDHDEVSEVSWMPLSTAVTRLTYADERVVALRARKEGGTYRSPASLDIAPTKGWRRWLWSQKHDYARLLRELRAFRVELALLEARSQQQDRSWAAAAWDQLNNVAHYLEKKNKDVEGGWVCFHAARRYAMHALDQQELALEASMLRAESAKFSSWRADEMKRQLAVADEEIEPKRVANAMALRDEYASNQYHKIWLMGDQLSTLLIIAFLGLLLLLPPLVVCSSLYPDCPLHPWGYQMVTAILFFGLLGAAFSTAGSLMSATAQTKIPERVANRFVTITRSLFGAGVGLAGYAFYQSKVLDIHLGSEGSPSGALAVAFLFGFAGERLIARVLGSLGAEKS
jgi:8-oxo-dGTP diphosphatase